MAEYSDDFINFLLAVAVEWGTVSPFPWMLESQHDLDLLEYRAKFTKEKILDSNDRLFHSEVSEGAAILIAACRKEWDAVNREKARNSRGACTECGNRRKLRRVKGVGALCSACIGDNQKVGD
jgi:hypothetical protein